MCNLCELKYLLDYNLLIVHIYIFPSVLTKSLTFYTRLLSVGEVREVTGGDCYPLQTLTSASHC